jgi:hypothetical protein
VDPGAAELAQEIIEETERRAQTELLAANDRAARALERVLNRLRGQDNPPLDCSTGQEEPAPASAPAKETPAPAKPPALG